MAARKHKPIEVGTAGLIGIAIFLLVWNAVEQFTGTGPKDAPPGTTHHAAARAGATVTPSEQPPVLEQ